MSVVVGMVRLIPVCPLTHDSEVLIVSYSFKSVFASKHNWTGLDNGWNFFSQSCFLMFEMVTVRLVLLTWGLNVYCLA